MHFRVLKLVQQMLQSDHMVLLGFVGQELLSYHVWLVCNTSDKILLLGLISLLWFMMSWFMSNTYWTNSVVLMISNHLEYSFFLATDHIFPLAHTWLEQAFSQFLESGHLLFILVGTNMAYFFFSYVRLEAAMLMLLLYLNDNIKIWLMLYNC